MISATQLAEVARGVGLENRPVIVHSSFSAFGGEVHSPDDVIDALLDIGCTVMMPSFTYEYELTRPSATGPVFDPAGNDLTTSEMGAMVRALLERPERVRGRHPIDSFSAVGPLADELIREQTPMNVYPPLEALCEMGGRVILMGVGLTRMTLVHLAEVRAGRKLLARYYNAGNGKVGRALVGGCSEGFGALDEALRPAERQTYAGSCLWRVFDAPYALDLASEAIRREPRITHCGRPCERCEAVIGQ